jgi:hypothetical protein
LGTFGHGVMKGMDGAIGTILRGRVCKSLFGMDWRRSIDLHFVGIDSDILPDTTCSVLSGNKHYILYTDLRFTEFTNDQKKQKRIEK